MYRCVVADSGELELQARLTRRQWDTITTGYCPYVFLPYVRDVPTRGLMFLTDPAGEYPPVRVLHRVVFRLGADGWWESSNSTLSVMSQRFSMTDMRLMSGLPSYEWGMVSRWGRLLILNVYQKRPSLRFLYQ